MKRWLTDLDRILRGEATRLDASQDEALPIPLGGLLLVILLLAAIYGACMGFFAGFREGGACLMQWLAAVVKVPSLLFLTVAVTFPSLYVFNALVGSRLSFLAILRLLVASLAVSVAVLASLGPIVAFFSVSTTSYPFMLLLNVLVFLVSGILGLAFLRQTLNRWNIRATIATPSETESRNDTLDRNVKKVFTCWMVAVMLVGGQMAWVLRPLLGKPTEAFHWFSPRESNFLHAILEAFSNLFS